MPGHGMYSNKDRHYVYVHKKRVIGGRESATQLQLARDTHQLLLLQFKNGAFFLSSLILFQNTCYCYVRL